MSIALHVVFFAFFIAAPPAYLGSLDRSAVAGPNETTTVAYLTIEHRPVVATPLRRVAVANKPAPTPAAHPKPKRSAPQKSTEPLPVRPDLDPRAMTAMARRDAPGKIQVAIATAPPERDPAEAAQQVEKPAAQPAETAAPASEAPVSKPAPAQTSAPEAPVAQTAAQGNDVPPGGWGNSFAKPLIADDTALAALRSRYHGSIEVDVDESGKATKVVLPAGISDDDRADLEKRLLAMRYVPAECNGLRCTGVIQLTL